jgi:hypothetical protein
MKRAKDDLARLAKDPPETANELRLRLLEARSAVAYFRAWHATSLPWRTPTRRTSRMGLLGSIPGWRGLWRDWPSKFVVEHNDRDASGRCSRLVGTTLRTSLNRAGFAGGSEP